MFRTLKLVCLFFVSLVLTGCLDINDTYTINPDGSGKVVHEAVLTSMNFSLDGSGNQAPSEEKLKKSILDEIKKAKGIDVWRDVSFEQRGEDKIYFKGTAYFKDINAVKFHNSGASINIYDDVSLTKNNDQMVLLIKSAKKDEGAASDKMEESITSENVDEKLLEIKREYEKTRMMAAGIFAGIQLKRTFYLAGDIVSHSNFEKSEDGSIKNSFDGMKLLQFMDAMMRDEELLKSELLKGNNPLKGDGTQDELKINEFVFGKKAPIQATVTMGSSPLFDYASEVQQAKAEYNQIAQNLGAPKKVEVKPGKGGHFKVGGVRMIRVEDAENNIRPFNFNKGYALSIIGRLPQKVLNVTEGRILTASTDHGQNLLPEKDWDQKISFPRVSKDKMKVIFEINLKVPAQSAKSISEISGVLEYLVADTTKTVDLHINDFLEGSEGTSFKAKIKSLKDSQWSPGKEQMELDVHLSRDSVKSVEIYDSNGNLLDVQQGYSAYGDRTTYNYTLNDGGKFPEKGRIVMEVYEDPQKYELPFALKNISLLGREIN